MKRFLGYLLAITLTTSAVVMMASVVLGDEDEPLPVVGGDPEPVGDRFEIAPARYEAAMYDLRREQDRVAQAQARFSAEAATTASQERDYLVSFTSPVASRAILTKVPDVSQLSITTFYAWLQLSASSVYVGTGTHDAVDIGWDNSAGRVEETLGFFKDFYQGFLASRADNLQVTAETTNDEVTQRTLMAQAEESVALAGEMSATSVPLYGIRCTCSPSALQTLATLIPGLGLRAVEPAGQSQYPLWPRDPLRDLIIASGGAYGI